MSITPDDSLPPPMPDPVGVPPRLAPEQETVLAQLARDFLRERRAERRWRLVFRLFWLSLAILFVYSLWAQGRHVTPSTTPHTALIEVRGEIAADGDASAELLLAALKDAFKDDAAQAVVLRINSPGGSPVQAGIVYDEIKRLKKQYDKPVYAVVEEMCASGAYYIAAAADEIFVDKASVVGSIGVLMDGFGFTGIMEKVGVERRLLTAGENKGFLDPFSPMSDAQRAHAQQMLDEIHRQFIDVVKSGRGDRLKVNSPGLFSGLFWSGQQAVELGLADQLGNIDYVAREVIKAEEVIDYTRRENVAEKLAKKFGSALGDASVRAMRSMPALR